ncbi:MAG: ABC transporter ATP-binding protein [Puniceicoccaceae bacterium]|nr:MAG: ABC transporter ATP-binding protein [Puniceicoccaceae bacterium]
MAVTTTVLQIEAVTKTYGATPALEAFSLDVRRGEFLGLLGPNGAGKSTLMLILSGFLRPDAGKIVFGWEGGEDLAKARRRLGVVPQEIALYDDLPARTNLRIFGELQGLRGSALREAVEDGLKRARLEDRARHPVKELSGGMKRRLNLAAALLHRPEILLCDEPTVGVDPQARQVIYQTLEELRAEGMTILYTTHYMEEARRLCDRVAIIDLGRLLALGTVSELLEMLPFEEEMLLRKGSLTPGALEGLLGPYGNLDDAGEHLAFRPRAGCPLSKVFSLLEEAGIPSRGVTLRQPDLETLFLHLTGHQLRE